MNSYIPVNRVEADLNQWREREARFSKLFSFNLSTNKALLKEKLEYYDLVAAKYRGSNDLEERLTLKMLRQERSSIAKQLYPNPMIRLVRRLLVAPAKRLIVKRRDNKRTENNNQELYFQVQRAGFNDLSAKIQDQMKLGKQQFSVPVSYYLNDKERLDHQLSFVKDQSGLYHFEGYKTSLYDESRPTERCEQFFGARSDYQVNAAEAYNLLSGRCVQRQGSWLQLDFNDKDAQGNFRIKQFNSDDGYYLEKNLRDLPLREMLNKDVAEKLLSELKNGSRVSVSFIKDGNEQRFYIEANPRFKSINIYDEHSRKTTLQTALGGKTVEAMKVAHKASESQHKNLEKRNGMRMKG